MYRENDCFLFLGPVGSDQSRHVDDFGAKTRNVDYILSKKSSFYDFDARCYPIVGIKSSKSIGKNECFLTTGQNDFKVILMYPK